MSTSKRDFAQVAAILHAEQALARGDLLDRRVARLETIENLTASIADHFAQTNPRFDRSSFYIAALGRNTVRRQP